MSQPVRIKSDVAARVSERAVAERRSFANMVEVLLLAALTERVGSAGVATDSGTPDVRLRGTAGRAPAPARSVSADVAATIPGVQVLRPHMRRDRPALQCEGRVVAGEVCSVCGGVG